MKKLEPFDSKQTKWLGLWWHPEYNGFSSSALNLSVLKQFKGTVRLYVRKNRYFNKGENGRPNYVFCIKDAKSDEPYTMEIETEEENDVQTDKNGNRLYTEDEVYQVIHGMENYYGLSYGNNLIEDYI